MILMVLMVADKRRNAFMKAADLCPDHKVFVEWCTIEAPQPRGVSNEAYAARIISESKKLADKDFWIPALIIAGELYSDPAIREISDGRNIIFVNGVQ